MATKNHVDSSVAERRLRPIYNWLDEGNNKKALQEAEKVLKKQPHFHCAKVLKGLALLRLGKESECNNLLEAVRKDLQYDDSTLQAMTICYREMNKPEDICEVYSDASKKDPKNEELLTHLFMAFVRVCDYKKQQQTAMTLYKLKFKNHYYFWTIMSIVMQAHEAGPELAKSLQLPLAEKMVKKFVDENKIEAEQEVQLYLLILEMQNKLEDALAVVEGPLGEMLHSYIVVPIKRVELLVRMNCWRKANVEIKKLLLDDMDNWSLYLDYFKTVFNLGLVHADLSGNGVDGEASDQNLNDCVKFLSDLQSKNQSESHRLRGPYLAIMEFFVQLQKSGVDAELHFGFFTDLLIAYFQNFGSKTCCLNDLRPYLDCLSESLVPTFLDEIWKYIELEEGQLPTTKEQMLRYISNLHITRYLGFHEKLTVAAKVQLADCLLRYYIHGAQFNISPLLPTDIRHNDPFVILIVEVMNDLWLDSKDACYLKNAIVVLEHALEKSPSNHQFKVLLIKLYNTLGITKAAQKIYELLDVKHVQLDSMGYLQSLPLISTGQYFLASHLCELTLKFFTSNYKDSADHLTFLYKFGSFLKINEFIAFRERLNNSLHYSTITVEKMLLEIFHSSSYHSNVQLVEQMTILPEKESIQFEKLEDNRDLDLCWTSDPQKRQLSNKIVQTSLLHDVEFLKVRSLLLRILAGMIQLSNTKSTAVENGNDNSFGVNNLQNEPTASQKTLEVLADQLKQLLTRISNQNFSRLPKDVINAPLDSRLFYLLEIPYTNLLISLLETLLVIVKEDQPQADKMFGQEKTPISKLSESISKFSTECKSSDHTQLGLRPRFLNILTLLTEMVSVACLVCGVAFDIVKSRTSYYVKKGKKKKDHATLVHVKKNDPEKETMSTWSNIVQVLHKLTKLALQDIDSCVDFLKDKWRESMDSDKDVSELMSMFNLDDIGFPELCVFEKTVLDSYQSSLTEIQNLIKLKTKYLLEIKV